MSAKKLDSLYTGNENKQKWNNQQIKKKKKEEKKTNEIINK